MNLSLLIIDNNLERRQWWDLSTDKIEIENRDNVMDKTTTELPLNSYNGFSNWGYSFDLVFIPAEGVAVKILTL